MHHNARYSCERCTERRIEINKHTYSKGTNSPLRTGFDLLRRMDPGHHKGDDHSLSTTFNVGMVNAFSPDYIHHVCIRVCKRHLLRLKDRRFLIIIKHLSGTKIEALDV